MKDTTSVWTCECDDALRVRVHSYTADQRKVLGKKATVDEPETVQFLKTLKTCRELK